MPDSTRFDALQNLARESQYRMFSAVTDDERAYFCAAYNALSAAIGVINALGRVKQTHAATGRVDEALLAKAYAQHDLALKSPSSDPP